MDDDVSEISVRALARMVRQLFDEDSPQSTLDRIVSAAADEVEGCDGATALMVRDRGQLETWASTAPCWQRSDEMQVEVGEGPCFDAIEHRRECFHIPAVGEDERWPRYAARARELGIGSAMGFLLFTARDTLGALNLYAERPRAFPRRSENVAWVFASQAAVAFASALNDAQLHEALRSRQEIGAAVGIAMERFKIPREQAFDALVTLSQHRNVKLREVARGIVETGEVS